MPVRLNLWLYDDFVRRLDRWRRTHENPPSRNQALKAAAELGMTELERKTGLPPLPPAPGTAPKADDDDGGGEDEADKAASVPNAAKPPAGAKPKPAPRGKPKKGE